MTEPRLDHEPAPASPESAEPPPERQSTPFLVLQFFIFPMAIVAVCVAVFVVFGLIAAEGKSAREYVNEVRSGGANRRWQAAFELSKLIQAGKDPALRDPRFAAELAALFDEAERDDPRVRRYLALALGRVGDAHALPALLRAVQNAGPDADSETVIFAIWALGAIRDAAAIPELVRLAAAPDAGIRKAAVHALGSFPGEAAQARLRESLADAVADVRWNAALALARRGDTAALPVLHGMLDRGELARVAELTAEQREQVLEQAVAAAAFLPDSGLGARLEALRDRDPNLEIRQAADAALRSRASPTAAR
jgi:HEAT repeat protein